jgi:hypothetical protein
MSGEAEISDGVARLFGSPCASEQRAGRKRLERYIVKLLKYKNTESGAQYSIVNMSVGE